jgi:hypothetical protein
MATLAELARDLSDATGVAYTEVDIARALRGRRARGSSNYVVRVDGAACDGAPGVALRVALGKTDDDDAERERALGRAAFEGGFGLEPLFAGKIHVPPRGVRIASCWPWGKCIARTDAGEETGAAVLRALRAAAPTMLALDAAAARNHVIVGASAFLIDFDPYFTRTVASDEQRAASRGFVAVAMALLRLQVPIFSVEQVDAEAPPSTSGAALFERLADAVVSVAASFPDAARAMLCVVQMYASFGITRGLERGHAAFYAMEDANFAHGADRVVAARAVRAHALLFMRAALGAVTPVEFAEEYVAHFAPLFAL